LNHSEALDLLLESGLAEDPLDHARQIGMATAVISEAFAESGFRVTLVGGSAIEVYAPGIFKTGDIDLIIEALKGVISRDELNPVFERLGFEKRGRHWRRGSLFVEVPATDLTDHSDRVRIGHFEFNVIAKEALLSERLAGYKHWEYTASAQQAVDMIAAFGDDLRMEILEPLLKREGTTDAFGAIRTLAESAEPITDDKLRVLLEHLRQR
jgi:hypothetical protein